MYHFWKRFVAQKGLTLLELLIAMSITAIVGVVLLDIIIQNNGLVFIQQAKVSQGLSLNNAHTEIFDAIHNAAQIAATCPSPTCTASYSSTKNSIVLAIPSLNASGNPITNTYDYEVITADSQNNDILREYIYPNSSSTRKSQNKVLSTTLASLTFYYLDSKGLSVNPSSAIQVNFVINLQQQAGQSVESSSSGQVNLRNN